MHPRPKRNKAPRPSVVPDVIVLCGGLGTRLRPVVSDRPKVLADINGTVFIDLLLKRLSTQGFRRIILSIGYRGKMIKTHMKKSGTRVIFSEESEPLGTGGAVKNAWPLLSTDQCFVMNGDTLCAIDLQDFFRFHTSHETPMSMVVTPSLRSDGGGIVLNDNRQIVRFQEKESGKASYLSAGIYAFRHDTVSLMPAQSIFSLEYDFFPSLVERFPCFGYVTSKEAIDIGTKERYHKAIKDLRI